MKAIGRLDGADMVFITLGAVAVLARYRSHCGASQVRIF